MSRPSVIQPHHTIYTTHNSGTQISLLTMLKSFRCLFLLFGSSSMDPERCSKFSKSRCSSLQESLYYFYLKRKINANLPPGSFVRVTNKNERNSQYILIRKQNMLLIWNSNVTGHLLSGHLTSKGRVQNLKAEAIKVSQSESPNTLSCTWTKKKTTAPQGSCKILSNFHGHELNYRP